MDFLDQSVAEFHVMILPICPLQKLCGFGLPSIVNQSTCLPVCCPTVNPCLYGKNGILNFYLILDTFLYFKKSLVFLFCCGNLCIHLVYFSELNFFLFFCDKEIRPFLVITLIDLKVFDFWGLYLVCKVSLPSNPHFFSAMFSSSIFFFCSIQNLF